MRSERKEGFCDGQARGAQLPERESQAQKLNPALLRREGQGVTRGVR